MQRAKVRVTPWHAAESPSEQSLRLLLAAESLHPYRWSNGPHDVYAAHTHPYDKVIYVVSGSIDFGLPASGESMTLGPGDRLDLPRGTAHDAVVGPEGVVCLEAHR
jgi:quercetin dioxygenase-like cupin family protein